MKKKTKKTNSLRLSITNLLSSDFDDNRRRGQESGEHQVEILKEPQIKRAFRVSYDGEITRKGDSESR